MRPMKVHEVYTCLCTLMVGFNHQNCEILQMVLPQSKSAAYKRGFAILKREMKPKSLGAAYNRVWHINGISGIDTTGRGRSSEKP